MQLLTEKCYQTVAYVKILGKTVGVEIVEAGYVMISCCVENDP